LTEKKTVKIQTTLRDDVMRPSWVDRVPGHELRVPIEHRTHLARARKCVHVMQPHNSEPIDGK